MRLNRGESEIEGVKEGERGERKSEGKLDIETGIGFF